MCPGRCIREFSRRVPAQSQPQIYVWPEYLSAARSRHRAAGRLFVLSPVDLVIAWAGGLFPNEPKMEPLMIGRGHVPVIDNPRRALREPELAVLSAVFHGAHPGGHEVLAAAGVALRSLPPHKREDYSMLLEDALPEDMMDQVRKITLQEAQAGADHWMRTRGPYVIGHREGLAEGRSAGLEQGRSAGLEQGLLQGRRDALAVVLEVRGLTSTAAEQARIAACTDRATLERWCERAKTAATVAELFAADD